MTEDPPLPPFDAMKALDRAYELDCRVRIISVDEESGSGCIKDYLTTEGSPLLQFLSRCQFSAYQRGKGMLRARISKEFSPVDSPVRLLSMSAGERFNVVRTRQRRFLTDSLLLTSVQKLLSCEGVNVSSDSVENFCQSQWCECPCDESRVWSKRCYTPSLWALSLIDWGERIIIIPWGSVAEAAADTRGSGLGIDCADEISGPLTCNVGIMRYSEGLCQLSFDIRYPVTDYEGIFEKTQPDFAVSWHAM